MCSAFLGLPPLADLLEWRRRGCVSVWLYEGSGREGSGWKRQLCGLDIWLTIGSIHTTHSAAVCHQTHTHSLTSLRFPLLFPSFPCLSPAPPKHTHTIVCVHVQLFTHTFCLNPPPPPPPVSRYSKLSHIIVFLFVFFPTVSSFLPWKSAYSWITPTHVYTHTHTFFPPKSTKNLLWGQRKAVLTSSRRGVSRPLSVWCCIKYQS